MLYALANSAALAQTLPIEGCNYCDDATKSLITEEEEEQSQETTRQTRRTAATNTCNTTSLLSAVEKLCSLHKPHLMNQCKCVGSSPDYGTKCNLAVRLNQQRCIVTACHCDVAMHSGKGPRKSRKCKQLNIILRNHRQVCAEKRWGQGPSRLLLEKPASISHSVQSWKRICIFDSVFLPLLAQSLQEVLVLIGHQHHDHETITPCPSFAVSNAVG